MTRDPYAYAADVLARRATLPCTCPACVYAENQEKVQRIIAAAAARACRDPDIAGLLQRIWQRA